MTTSNTVPGKSAPATNPPGPKLTGNITVDDRTYTVHGTECTGRAMFCQFRDENVHPKF